MLPLYYEFKFARSVQYSVNTFDIIVITFSIRINNEYCAGTENESLDLTIQSDV